MVRIGFRSALWLSIVLAWLTLAVALAVLWSVVAPGKTPRIQAAPRIKGRRGI